jgi:hypothetical protein
MEIRDLVVSMIAANAYAVVHQNLHAGVIDSMSIDSL